MFTYTYWDVHVNLVPWYLTDCTENKHWNRSFFFLTFCCVISPISGSIHHYCIMKKLKKKKSGKNNKLRTISPKTHENFKNSKPRVVLLVLIKKSVYTSTGRRKPLQCNLGSTLSFRWRYLFFYFQSESPFVYKVINNAKLSMTNFQNQSPQNIQESLSLNNTICIYNTPYIFFFVLFSHLLFFL